MIKEILKDFRGFMKNAYTVAWDIIGVGGREDIISTLGSLIEINLPEEDKSCGTISQKECPAIDGVKPEKIGKSDLKIIRGLQAGKIKIKLSGKI